MKHKLPTYTPSDQQTGRLHFTLLVFAASLFASALIIIYNNSTRTFSVFVFLLFFGVGMMLSMGLVRGTFAGLLIISLWIALKQLLGVWEEIRLINNLVELAVAALSFVVSGMYHDRLQAILSIYKKNRDQLQQLDIEDKAVGLIRPSMGLLRLHEEEERSVRYRRPFALILIVARPIPGTRWDAAEEPEIIRSIATNLKDTTRETDIPFLAGRQKIAIILPETETNGANKVINNVYNRMLTTRFLSQSGTSKPIQSCVQLRLGFAAFLGESHAEIDMLGAAERSLQKSLGVNDDDLFLNLFLEWETIGETPLSTALFERVIP